MLTGQIYVEAESNANARALDWFILQQTGDLRSHGSCGMNQSQKPTGLHCRGATVYVDMKWPNIAGAESRTNFICYAEALQYMWT